MFAFDLALALGECDPDAMLRRIPLPTFYEWTEYAERKPFGEERGDLRIGYALAKLATLWTTQSVKPYDFMPNFGGRTAKKRQTPQEVRNLIEGMMAAQQKQLGKAPDSSQTAAKGPRIDDRGPDGPLDPGNA